MQIVDRHASLATERDDKVTLPLFQATFDGCIVAAALPREVITRWLPRGLALAENDDWQGNSHPVLCMCGDHRRGAIWIGRRCVSGPVVYQECAIVVPFVNGMRDTRAFNFLVGMVCGYPLATFVGTAFYGYPKVRGRVVWDQTGCAVLTNETLLRIEILSRKPAAAASAARVIAWLEAPIVSRRTHGPLIASRWQLEAPAAEWWRLNAHLEICLPLVAGGQPIAAPALPGQAFLVRGLCWTLSVPHVVET